MSALFFRYYLEVTKYNLLFCIIYFLVRFNPAESIILFGSAGSIIAFFAFRYFQNIEYYFYLNGGIIKKNLYLGVVIINILVSIILLTILWSIKFF